MAVPGQLWIDSPRRMTTRIRERLSVGDSALIDRLVAQVLASAESPNRHYSLLVGPAGAGKSHLLARVCQRVEAELPDELVMAWLPDSIDGLVSELHLFAAILVALGGSTQTLEDMAITDRERAFESAQASVVERLGERVLVLVVEDLDQVLAAIGAAGQRRLRGFLQEERRCTLLATARRVTEDFTAQDRAFFGFFSVHRLPVFDAKGVVDLMGRRARVRDDRQLAIQVPARRFAAQLKALHHVLGGLPGRYVDLLRTIDDLNQPVTMMLRAIDECRVRYRWQTRGVSVQQRLILDWLRGRAGAFPVKRIARECFISEQTVSPQLRVLRKADLVASTRVGRETHYELRDPLAGIESEYGIELFAFLCEFYADRDAARAGTTAIARRLRAAASAADPRVVLALPRLERDLIAG